MRATFTRLKSVVWNEQYVILGLRPLIVSPAPSICRQRSSSTASADQPQVPASSRVLRLCRLEAVPGFRGDLPNLPQGVAVTF